jgi:hypothetical protein
MIRVASAPGTMSTISRTATEPAPTTPPPEPVKADI